LNLAIGLIAILVSRISLLNDVGHFLSLFMQFFLELLVQIIKDNSFTSKTIDDLSQFPVHSDGLIELLISLIESVFENLDLLLKSTLILGSGIVATHIILLLNDLLLKVNDMDIRLLL
jgi:hypothetical protein